MGIFDEIGQVAEGAVDQIGNTYQAFLYGQPMHTAQYGTYNPSWFNDAEMPEMAGDDMGIGDARHISEFSPSDMAQDIQPDTDINTADLDLG